MNATTWKATTHRLTFVFAVLLKIGAVDAQDHGNEMADKLVNGSPWQFTTKYENTVHEFRFDEAGQLQRKSARTGNAWVPQPVRPDGTFLYQTANGHTITYSLGQDSRPTARHSKHESVFQSIK